MDGIALLNSAYGKEKKKEEGKRTGEQKIIETATE